MKKYNVGIVGYGWVATAHIPAINASTLGKVTAICSSRKLDAAEVNARHGGGITVYQDLDDLLANPDIDVISLCGFPTKRLDQIERAAKAGKHLIIEKPICLSLAELKAIEKAVRRAKVKSCVCFECRFASQFVVTKAMVDDGLLGQVHYGEVDYYHGIGPWYGQFAWCQRKSEGGSSLLEAGCHAMDALLLCMGDEAVEVTSYATKTKSPIFAPYEYPTTSVTLVKFRNGAVGKCTSCIDCLQPYYFHTHLVGSKGSLLDNKFHAAGLRTDKAAWSSLAMKLVDSGDVSDHPYQAQFEAFFNALDKGREMPLTTLSDAIRSHKAIFAADLSAERGRPVKLSELKW